MKRPPCDCIMQDDQGIWTMPEACYCGNRDGCRYASAWGSDENASAELTRLQARVEVLESLLAEVEAFAEEDTVDGEPMGYNLRLTVGQYMSIFAALKPRRAALGEGS